MAHITLLRCTRARLVALLAAMALLLTAVAMQPASAATGTDTWVAAPSMGFERGSHTATLLPDGDIVVAGGAQWESDWAESERFDVQTQTWSPVADLYEGRQAGHTATALTDGRVLVAGGVDYWGPMQGSEIFDPETNTWTPTTYRMNEARAGHAAVRLNDGRVLVVYGSGEGTPQENSPTAEVFDPKSQEWTYTAPPPVRVRYPQATLLPSGLVVVTGAHSDATGRTLLYNPLIDRWSQGANMPVERQEHSATLLQDGTVLVAGGYHQDSWPVQSDAEIYDPLLDRWTRVEQLAPGVVGRHSVLLRDGRVLFAGEAGPTGADGDTMLFDPRSKTWTQAPDSQSHSWPALTMMADGRVMLSGSEFGYGERVEIFDAADLRPQQCKTLPVCPPVP